MTVVEDRSDRVSQTYRALRDLIVRGNLPPGARIVESEVVRRLSVSRTSVRGALQRLQQERYVSAAVPGRRARPAVTPLGGTDATELFTIIGEIEGMAAEQAARLPIGERRKLVKRLRAINAEFIASAALNDPHHESMFVLDTRFHRAYVDAGAGPRLLALHDALKPQVERYIRLYVATLFVTIRVSGAEHRAIIRAIERGRGAEAQRTVRVNWRNGAARFRAVIDIQGDEGFW